jgi:hypothetical protein
VKSPQSTFNGVLFQVNDAELKRIMKREDEYSLAEEWAYDFLTGKKLCKCLIVIDYVVSTDKDTRKPKKDTRVTSEKQAITRELI